MTCYIRSRQPSATRSRIHVVEQFVRSSMGKGYTDTVCGAFLAPGSPGRRPRTATDWNVLGSPGDRCVKCFRLSRARILPRRKITVADMFALVSAIDWNAPYPKGRRVA